MSDQTNVAATGSQDGPEIAAMPGSIWLGFALALGGIFVTILGARLTLDAAVTLALLWGMSETVVGLTGVAVGTSLPELVTSVRAALRREAGLASGNVIAFGNVIGSNIYNILRSLGITALVRPIPIPPQIAQLDVLVLTTATLSLIIAVVA